VAEQLQLKNHQERASNNLTFMQYVHSQAMIFMAPVIGFAGGYLLSHKIMPNSWLGKPYFNWAKPSIEILEEETGLHLDLAELEKETSGIKMGEGWGAKIGIFIGLFSIWRDDTKEKIDVHRLDGGLASLQRMQSYNNFIKNENEYLAQQNIDIAGNDNRYLELENKRLSDLLQASKPSTVIKSGHSESRLLSLDTANNRNFK
jgi:hypothetical protein